MPSAKRSITIRRPVDEVFAYVADGLNARKWRSGVIDISLDKGEGVGAVYRQGVKGLFGRRVAADYEITALEANRRLAFKAIAGPVRPNGEFTFKTANDATTVTFSLDAELSGLRRWLMGRPVQRTMNAEMRALDKLKSNLERGGKSASTQKSTSGSKSAADVSKPAASAAKPATRAKPAAGARRTAKKPATAQRTSGPSSVSKTGAANPKPTSRRSPSSRRTPPQPK